MVSYTDRVKHSLPLLLLLTFSFLLNTIGIVRWNAGAPYDTAHKGIETIEEVLQGNLAPFYRHYNGQPPFMDWFLAPLFLFVGVSAYTLHVLGIVSALMTTWLLYLTGKVLWSHRAGLYASLFGTTSHWLLLESREGTHNIPLVPLLLAVIVCTALVWRAKTIRGRYVSALLGGVASGVMGYVYAAGWIFPIVFAVVFPILIVASWFRAGWGKQSVPLVIMTVVMVFLWVPFVRFTMDDPQIVFMHADDEVGTREPGTIVARVLGHVPSMVGAFTYLVVPPFSNWELNTKLYWAGIPIGFPIPFVSPGAAVLLIGSVVLVCWGLYKRQPVMAPLILVVMLGIAVLPNLMTDGPQPHYRRAVCAMAPLFLLIGWAASQVHEWVMRSKRSWQTGWWTYVFLAVVYGPWLYFALGVSSVWFAENYQTKHDRVAPILFARVAAGQKVVLAGNTAHMKPFQFYALATPQGRQAFHLLNLHTEAPWPDEVVQKADVLIYVSSRCEEMVLPGFLPKSHVLRSRFGVDGCVFDRPGVSSELQGTRVDLPVSGPLWPAFVESRLPLESHQPFYGPIFGI